VVYTSVDLGGRLVRIPNSGVLMAALTVTNVPLQLDIEVQLPAQARLGELSLAISKALKLSPRDSVQLRPVQLQVSDQSQLLCQLQVRCRRPVEVADVMEVLSSPSAAPGPPAAEPGAG
jgi:hypothetical protein